MEKLFSILISACNQEDKVIDSLKCIYKQNFYNCEILVIQDPKSRLSKILDHVSFDRDIKILFIAEAAGENICNLALQACKGRYILFMQEDEFYSTDYLHECCKKALISKNKLIVADKAPLNQMDTVFKKIYDRDLIQKNRIRFDNTDHSQRNFNLHYMQVSSGIVYCEKAICRKNF